MTDVYEELAKAQLDAEDKAAAEQRVTDRASALRLADERKQLHAALCAEHDLPLTATPRQISDAMARRRDEVLGAYLAGGGTVAKLCGELGLDPNNLPDPWHPYECVWQEMRSAEPPASEGPP
jgi:hypothetical protein